MSEGERSKLMSCDWNVESGSMGTFYYQLDVGKFGPNVRMGGGGGGGMCKGQRSGYSSVTNNKCYEIHFKHNVIANTSELSNI